MAPSRPLAIASSRRRLVIAHRGDRAHAPENTLVAFERAIAAGADALELDVRTSADGHLVVLHDALLDRTTDGRGAVDRLTLAALRELDAGARWSPDRDPERANGGVERGSRPFAGQGIRIPTLGEVLEAFPTTPFLVEVKTVAAGRALVPLLDRYRAREKVLVGSFLIDALGPARTAGYATTAARRELLVRLPAVVLGVRRRCHPFQVVALPPRSWRLPVPVGAFVRSLHCPVDVWTVNDPQAARRYWECGVRGIITDDPERVAAVRL